MILFRKGEKILVCVVTQANDIQPKRKIITKNDCKRQRPNKFTIHVINDELDSLITER